MKTNKKIINIWLFLLYFSLLNCTPKNETTSKQNKQLTIHLADPNYITNYYIPLEQTCYELLKKNPIQKNINYLAVGWKYGIDNGRLKHIIKNLENKHFDGGFTVCQHIHPEVIIPLLKKIGIDTLFTPHVDNNKKYAITVLPLPHFAMNGTQFKELPDKDILYSFIGFVSCRFRKKIFQIKNPINTVIKPRRTWHFTSLKKKHGYANEYNNVLQRSRFSLCPRGSGPSTLRFWESLACGSIPVSIADNLILPDGFNWEQCVVFVAEKNILKIPEILAQITPEQEKQMRQKCFEAYALFSGENLVSTIRQHYA